MHEDLIEQLKKLSAIDPDSGFVRRARNRIVKPRLMPAWILRPILQSAGVAAAVLLAAGASTFFSSPSVVLSSSLDPQSIANELHDTVAIQVDQIRYETQGNAIVNASIREIKNVDTSHLSSDLLSSELESFGDSATSETVDELLKQITK